MHYFDIPPCKRLKNKNLTYLTYFSHLHYFFSHKNQIAMQKYYNEKSLKIFFESEFRNLKIHGYLIRLWVRMYLLKSIILFLKIRIIPPPSIQIFAISLKIIIFLCSQLVYFRLLNIR